MAYIDTILQAGQENNGNPNLDFLEPDNNFGIGYQPVKMDEIPNFLSSQWAIIHGRILRFIDSMNTYFM